MDFYSSYLTGINQIIGQNGRFARQFAANQQAGSGNTTGNTATPVTGMESTMGADSQTSTMLLMLFQLMARMMSMSEDGSSPGLSGDIPNPLAGYLPQLSNPTGNASTAQNPAALAIQEQVNAKMAGNPDEKTPVFSAEDVTQVRVDLEAGKYTHTQLGEALMYGLDQTPAENLQPITRLITDLTDSGELNIVPFLQNDYLSRLDNDRQQALLQAVETAGIRMDSGKPNSRLIGFMLDALAKPGDSASKRFSQTFLQDFYQAHGQRPDTPVGKTLAQMLELAGVTANEEGTLVF